MKKTFTNPGEYLVWLMTYKTKHVLSNKNEKIEVVYEEIKIKEEKEA